MVKLLTNLTITAIIAIVLLQSLTGNKPIGDLGFADFIENCNSDEMDSFMRQIDGRYVDHKAVWTFCEKTGVTTCNQISWRHANITLKCQRIYDVCKRYIPNFDRLFQPQY